MVEGNWVKYRGVHVRGKKISNGECSPNADWCEFFWDQRWILTGKISLTAAGEKQMLSSQSMCIGAPFITLIYSVVFHIPGHQPMAYCSSMYKSHTQPTIP